MTVAERLRQRRAAVRRADEVAARDALAQIADDLRDRARPLLAAGRSDLASPYLVEAELFEGAIGRVQPL